MNKVNEAISISTLPNFTSVQKGQLIATSKIIPFFLSSKCLTQAQQEFTNKPSLSIKPFVRNNLTIIFTKSQISKKSLYEKSKISTIARLKNLGLFAEKIIEIPHSYISLESELKRVCEKIKQDDTFDTSCILIFSAIATTDRQDIVPQSIVRSGGSILRFGLPVDPGNLTVIAELNKTPILGLPGCARSSKQNGFDWILERTLANIEITDSDIAKMGIGGLLKEMPNRPEPREPKERKKDKKKKNIALILLAAGNSKRMGKKNKLLEIVNGKSMIKHCVENISRLPIKQKVIVLGHEARKIKSKLDLATFKIINNLDYKNGISTSIKIGILSLDKTMDGVFIVLADMPMIKINTYLELINNFQKGNSKVIFIPTWQGKKGNPVLLDKSIFPELIKLEGDEGAQQIFSNFEDNIQEIEVNDSGTCFDIDTLEDLKAVKKNGT